ncbi:hypothetical protein MLD38_035785 [Melastoma candidum]|uniref:Uncharacterized protein n=1 Tax=Melastoma candidum TaxID=119954 RepID=A0ACB9LJH4_9MYRT|nr:hypothetical protein MLD38_035785 [Melastoma candidum]
MAPSSPLHPSADNHARSVQQQQQQFIGRAADQAQAQAQARRKGAGTRSWLIISDTGESRSEGIEKHAIMRRTGLPARDLRVLDPMLSYPSSILGRDRAIVVNLEHIKAVITATEVLIVNTNSPLVFRFVQDLRHRISCAHPADQQKMETESGNSLPLCDCKSPMWKSSGRWPEMDNSFPYKGGRSRTRNNSGVQKTLPFEFTALECCLKSACKCLESETHTLEEEAYPALDALTKRISTLNLERVRQIKSRLVAISGRVQKVRNELEHLLDDDNDMAEMYLTEKFLARSLETTSLKDHESADVPEEDVERLEDPSPSEAFDFDMLTSSKPNVEELEMLLEAYFAQIDGILQKLSDMNEYVEDTEDCINIMLNDKQNQLLQMGVMLTCANMILSAGVVVAGIFGMNIHISLFDSTPAQFNETVIGTISGCIALFLAAILWGKKRIFWQCRGTAP